MKKTYQLEITGLDKDRRLQIVDGALPYIWIGGKQCFGCIRDTDLPKLADALNKIVYGKKGKQ